MKILIWDYPFSLKNSGGPAGYLYNIHEYLKLQGWPSEIFFLKDLLSIPNNPMSNHQKYLKYLNLIDKIDILGLWDLVNGFRGIKTWYKKYKDEVFKNIDFNEYDAIHFHVSHHLLSSYDILKDYEGIKILTSHSPQPLYEEYCVFKKPYSYLNKIVKNKLQPKEIQAWKLADKIMFPVKDASEVYYSDKILKDYIISNPDKFVYCPTALYDQPSNDSIQEINMREKLNIPTDSFILSYIGRHNTIKGYDQLLNIGKTLLKEHPNLYIVVAGNQGPLKGLSHPRWIELGWVNYGRQIINQSDAFILPNQQTYFDIVALEVLREGTPLILTLTGGNKYFNNFDAKEKQGLFFYDYSSPEQVLKIINALLSSKQSNEIYKMRQANLNLYRSNFTMPIYISNYTALIKTMLS